MLTLSGTAAENKKPEDANSAAGIILVGRAWVFLLFPILLSVSIEFNIREDCLCHSCRTYN